MHNILVKSWSKDFNRVYLVILFVIEIQCKINAFSVLRLSSMEKERFSFHIKQVVSKQMHTKLIKLFQSAFIQAFIHTNGISSQ